MIHHGSTYILNNFWNIIRPLSPRGDTSFVENVDQFGLKYVRTMHKTYKLSEIFVQNLPKLRTVRPKIKFPNVNSPKCLVSNVCS